MYACSVKSDLWMKWLLYVFSTTSLCLFFCFQVREELHGRPYEKNQIELILSAVDVQDKYLTFLRNTEEDLSSIFCSELVAHAYQEFGLLGKTQELQQGRF